MDVAVCVVETVVATLLRLVGSEVVEASGRNDDEEVVEERELVWVYSLGASKSFGSGSSSRRSSFPQPCNMHGMTNASVNGIKTARQFVVIVKTARRCSKETILKRHL